MLAALVLLVVVVSLVVVVVGGGEVWRSADTVFAAGERMGA